jgi:hypothetical protein
MLADEARAALQSCFEERADYGDVKYYRCIPQGPKCCVWTSVAVPGLRLEYQAGRLTGIQEIEEYYFVPADQR